MEKPEQPFSRKLVTNLLLWATSIAWVLVTYLGVWVVLLHVNAWLGDGLAQRQQVVAYLLGEGRDGFPDIVFLNFAEARHLLDVRRLFAGVEHLFYWGLPCAGLLLVLQQRFAQWQVWWHTGFLGLASILLLGVLMLLGGFVPLFIFLHTLLFPAGTWVFPDDSILIQLFPLTYFLRFGLVYVGVVALVFGSLLVWGKRQTIPYP